MEKLLKFVNSTDTVTISPMGKVTVQSGDDIIFERVIEEFHRIYLDTGYGIYNLLMKEYKRFSQGRPMHIGHDCNNCYQHHPVTQKDVVLVEDDDYYVGIGMIGYCDKKTCLYFIAIYDEKEDYSVYDSTFFHSDMSYGIDPQYSLNVPVASNDNRSKLMEIMNNYLSQ